MKTVALIALLAGIVAAGIGIVFQFRRIRRAGTSDNWTNGTIIFAVIFILVAIFNLIFIIPKL